MTLELLGLLMAGLLAGFVDAIVGGGGLIQVPALLLYLHDQPTVTALGTGKLAASIGTLVAAITYLRRIHLQPRLLLAGALTAGACSFLGARAATLIPSQTFKPLVLLALVLVGLYTLFKPNLGSSARIGLRDALRPVLTVAAALGFYDGIIGPGTGSFMAFGLAGFGLPFLEASAITKVLNLSSNLSAMAYFAATGHVLYGLALPLAVCNAIGGFLGARVALAQGNGFVRVVFLLVVTGLLFKLGWEVLGH